MTVENNARGNAGSKKRPMRHKGRTGNDAVDMAAAKKG